MTQELPRYDVSRSYRWNFDHAPDPAPDPAPKPASCSVAPVKGDWRFCGLPIDSPLGVAAGPLLNGKWCLYYASLGFDLLTYKTVRSGKRDCYPLPNLQPVDCGPLSGSKSRVLPCEPMHGSWAVSFGMPSSPPRVWRDDVEWTRKQLPVGKLLCVSVVGTFRDGWNIDDLADDYATCARWAVESGADCIEANFSCPNVATCDGQLYLDPASSQVVAESIKGAIGHVPLIIKIGHCDSKSSMIGLVDAVGQSVSAMAMTNSIAARVGVDDQTLMFDGQPRGICGDAILEESIAQVGRFAKVIRDRRCDVDLIGVGGIKDAADVGRYLEAGAHACHLATAAMINPGVAIKIRLAL